MIKKVTTIIPKIMFGIFYMAIAIAIGITLVPFVAGYRPVVVVSGSMEPMYPVGSMVYYKASTFEDISEGDVITFRLGGGALVTHRVIKKDDTNREFVTKGDNNQTEDVQSIAYQAVVGKTGTIAIPYVGFVRVYLRKIPVIITIGLLLIVCTILSPNERKARGSICEE